MISVVIPLYNKVSSIAKTIESVLSQSYPDFEIVVVNDGSTDGSANVVRGMSDSRIRLIDQPNGGVSAARNRGIKEAKGEFIAFLDADDDWAPDYLETQYNLTQKYPDCSVFAVDYQFCDANGKVSSTIIRKLPFDGVDGELTNYFEVASSGHPPLWTSAVMVRKSAMEAVGGFPLGIKSGEDLLTWARLASRFKIAYSRQPKAVFNVEGYAVNERPKRVPAEIDVVGTELQKIADEYNPRAIGRYMSHWHKMRSSVYMRLKMRGKSIKEALIGLRYYPLNYKLYAYILLNFKP